MGSNDCAFGPQWWSPIQMDGACRPSPYATCLFLVERPLGGSLLVGDSLFGMYLFYSFSCLFSISKKEKTKAREHGASLDRIPTSIICLFVIAHAILEYLDICLKWNLDCLSIFPIKKNAILSIIWKLVDNLVLKKY